MLILKNLPKEYFFKGRLKWLQVKRKKSQDVKEMHELASNWKQAA
jgi:hypothetical protein